MWLWHPYCCCCNCDSSSVPPPPFFFGGRGGGWSGGGWRVEKQLPHYALLSLLVISHGWPCTKDAHSIGGEEQIHSENYQSFRAVAFLFIGLVQNFTKEDLVIISVMETAQSFSISSVTIFSVAFYVSRGCVMTDMGCDGMKQYYVHSNTA